MSSLDAPAIEKKWQQRWDEAGCFAARINPDQPKYYVLEMFPYPSGRIHIGHVRNYTLGDVVARVKRAKGFNVLHPMGWDAFGLPAENAAIERRVHPAKWTRENISTMRDQLKSMGLSYDWSREFATCDDTYYRFEQKMFLISSGRVWLIARKAGSTGTRLKTPCWPMNRWLMVAAGVRAHRLNAACCHNGFCASRRLPRIC